MINDATWFLPIPEPEPKYLDDFGLPNICMYPNGSMYNEETGHWYSDATMYVSVSSRLTGVQMDICRDKMYGYLFLAPWNYPFIPYVNLGFLGFPSYFATCSGHIFGCARMVYLKEDLSDDGYPEVTLYDLSSKPFYFKTHRLIAKSFVANPEHKDTVNHKDGVKTNNWWYNLEWMWNWENMDHALKTGLKHSAMSDELVHNACRLLSQGLRESDVAELLGIRYSNVRDILDGCHYRISRQYKRIPYLLNARHIPKEFAGEH